MPLWCRCNNSLTLTIDIAMLLSFSLLLMQNIKIFARRTGTDCSYIGGWWIKTLPKIFSNWWLFAVQAVSKLFTHINKCCNLIPSISMYLTNSIIIKLQQIYIFVSNNSSITIKLYYVTVKCWPYYCSVSCDCNIILNAFHALLNKYWIYFVRQLDIHISVVCLPVYLINSQDNILNILFYNIILNGFDLSTYLYSKIIRHNEIIKWIYPTIKI